MISTLNLIEQVSDGISQPALTCSNLTKKTLEQGVKHVQS